MFFFLLLLLFDRVKLFFGLVNVDKMERDGCRLSLKSLGYFSFLEDLALRRVGGKVIDNSNK